MQAETINRLLKKQSRPRNKRGTTATTLVNHTEDSTPVPAGVGGEEAEGEGGEKEEQEEDGQVEYLQGPPTMYRWISTSRPADSAVPATDSTMTIDPPTSMMSISFAVPVSLLPVAPPDDQMQVDGGDLPKPTLALKPLCSVESCGKERKYRLARGEWGQGACGIGCLKVLEGR